MTIPSRRGTDWLEIAVDKRWKIWLHFRSDGESSSSIAISLSKSLDAGHRASDDFGFQDTAIINLHDHTAPFARRYQSLRMAEQSARACIDMFTARSDLWDALIQQQHEVSLSNNI